MADKVEIVVPAGMFGAWEGEPLLVSILREVAERYGKNGEWAEKYGTDFENDKFKMHRFCWCENDDCPYCTEAEPNFYYKPKNLRVTWYKYIGRSMEVNKELDTSGLMEMRNDLLCE